MSNIDTKAEAKSLMALTKGKACSLTFVKKDGSVTTRNAFAKRLTALVGGVDKLAATEYVSFYDQNARGWRCFHPSNLVRLKCGKILYERS